MFILKILENIKEHQEGNKIISIGHFPQIVTLNILGNILLALFSTPVNTHCLPPALLRLESC